MRSSHVPDQQRRCGLAFTSAVDQAIQSTQSGNACTMCLLSETELPGGSSQTCICDLEVLREEEGRQHRQLEADAQAMTRTS